jgi:rhodanese-related sulfurtransferase
VSIDDLLAAARARLERVDPGEALAAVRDHRAVLVDIRSESQRSAHGVVPEAAFVARNVIEWRLDPESAWRDPELARTDRRVVVMCNEGYQSSLVAATLQKLGHPDATDVVGGFQAWREAGLPVAPATRRRRPDSGRSTS